MKRRNTQSAFTLIELLVVVAIISLLVSILLPSLTKAKALAHRTVCQTNLHNLGLATFLYDRDHGCYPPRTATSKRTWAVQLHPYTESQEVYVCPSDAGRGVDLYQMTLDRYMFYFDGVITKNPDDACATNYGMNHYLLWDYGRGHLSAGDIPRPAETLVFADGWDYWLMRDYVPNWPNNTDPFRHVMGEDDSGYDLNQCFTDGHVECMTNEDEVPAEGTDAYYRRWRAENKAP